MNIHKLLLGAASAFLSLSLSAQSLYFPPKTGSWETTSPASLGWCTNQIDSLYDFLDKGDSKAFIVLKDGKIVLEKYFGTFTQDSLWYWASAGKTLTGFATGIALQNGKLKLTDTSSKYLGKGWSSLTPEQEAKITVWHHITMTTGLDDGVPESSCTDKACLIYKADPGTRWAYHNAPYTLMDKVILGATGQNINAYVNSSIKPATGITGLFVQVSNDNVYFSTPRSFARFGLLMLGKGSWNGTAVLTDTAYFRQMTNTSQSINLSYGYLTWLNGKTSYRIPGSQLQIPGALMPAAPSDMYAALGKNGQYINVVPSQNLVLIRMGEDPSVGSGLVPTVFNDNIWKYLNKVMCNNNAISENAYTNSGVVLYPNPAENILHINTQNKVNDVSIYAISGKEMYKQNSAESIDISKFPSGIYFVKIQGDGIQYCHKIVVE